MRRVCASAAGVVVETAEPPPVHAGELGIRAACSLISPGTELHYVDESMATGKHLALGYCNTGIVEQVGPGVVGFAPGDRVAAMGWGYALHAETIAVPFRLCVRLPEDLAFDRAVFANLAATALHAVHRAALARGDRVLVVGAGLVGQLVAQCAGQRAGHVVVADRVRSRVDVSRSLGIEAFCAQPDSFVEQARRVTGGPDVIFLCIHGEATHLVRQCVELLVPATLGPRRPRLIAVGRFSATVDFHVGMGNLDIRYSARCGAGYRNDPFVHGRADVPVPEGEQTVTENLEECVRLIARGHIGTGPLVSHRIPLAEAPRAYELLKDPETALGVLLTYDPG